MQTLTEQLAAASTADAVFEGVLCAVVEALDARTGAIVLLNGVEDRLTVAASRGEESGWMMETMGHASLARDALTRHEALYFGNRAELLLAYPDGAIHANLPPACAALPMLLDGRGIGTVVVDWREARFLAPEERRFLRILTAQCAIALGRVQVAGELEARVALRTAELEARTLALQEERAALDAFVAYKEAIGSERNVLALAQQAIAVLRTSLAHISAAYYELDGPQWVARVWSEDVPAAVVARIREGVPLDAPDFAGAARSHIPMFTDGWNAAENGLPSARGYGAVGFVPLLIGDELHSLLTVGTLGHHVWTERERAIVRAVARGLGLTLERTEHVRQLARERTMLAARTAALDAFAELTHDLALNADPCILIQRAGATVLSLLPSGDAAFWESREGRWTATRPMGAAGGAEPSARNADLFTGRMPTLDAALKTVLDTGVLDTAVLDTVQHTRTPLYQDGPTQGSDALADSPHYPQAAAILPVLVRDEVRGVLTVTLSEARQWTGADRATLETVVRSLGLALERSGAQRELDRTQHYLRVAAENAPILLFATDAQGVFTLSEGRLLEQLGLRPGQAVGQSATVLFAREPDLREGRRLSRALAGEVAHDLTHFESSGVSLESWFIPVKDGAGVVTEVVGVSLDVTERLETQRRIERANADLRRSNAELEQFAYAASHDLQEPLRTVTSFSELLISKYSGQLDPRAEVYMRLISEGTGRMGQLLQDLLAFTQVTSGARELVRVDMNAALAGVVQDMQVQIGHAGATVSVGPLPDVQGDASQLRQVFQNLIDNALKFCDPRRPPVVQVGATLNGKTVRFSVTDNGIGIAPEFYGRIFAIFQRLHGREQYGGNGIGLAIARKIAERHGGAVWLESVPGQGSTFFLTLPTC
ncbi:GAF domain-containing sensor histidine kinase [Deinococcus arenicola]|uniref:histidine kinase n=1 Tax=Deinococcus arenicola TaxID=2994950 RepID=A0ABU4DSS3_9DEIO|nr:ATP-binding protein [Deinococcus sp. ZS9-10]MDV6375433.1 ATP-binding protein [Deinococcus sp. ZS9-10]